MGESILGVPEVTAAKNRNCSGTCRKSQSFFSLFNTCLAGTLQSVEKKQILGLPVMIGTPKMAGKQIETSKLRKGRTPTLTDEVIRGQNRGYKHMHSPYASTCVPQFWLCAGWVPGPERGGKYRVGQKWPPLVGIHDSGSEAGRKVRLAQIDSGDLKR